MPFNIFANRRRSFDNPALLFGAAAAGFAAGLFANFGRKAAVQSLTALKGEWDEGLKSEHRLTMKIFDAIEQTEEQDIARRKTLLVQLQHALAKHAVEEENVVYPAMRDHGQIEDADKLVHDHGYVKQYLFDLSEMEPDDPAWIAKVRTFRADIEAHVREEEEILFPRLKAALGDEGNAHITSAMNKAGFTAA
ncbi:hemerythrin domain-containing protein [Sphingopyxis sp. JAI128]|uniref:hemerythrin domain-containing protein n=1 Tax=Sphingopyxis sp. JAI128 TaxID=2723066 RepID=UPI00161C677A|nr:hemerythrin domain-containing protein [Sphingopyxis sp. JAI128]MBB6425367.1 hemerythrin superfamily protein [Sphingopyxis sp. JAI128]